MAYAAGYTALKTIKKKKQSFGDAFESCGAKTNKGQIILNI